MRDWLRAHPMVVLLLPVVAVILLCEHFGRHYTESDSPSFNTDTPAQYRVVLTDYPVARKKTWRCEAGNVYLYLQADSSSLPTLGDTLLVRTRWQLPDTLGTFDYGRYLRRQGIYAIGMVWKGNWKVVGHNPAPPQVSRRLQHALVERYETLGITGREHATLSALTLGYRENLDDDLRQSFSKAGAMHVLAVSGLHTGILYAVLFALLTVFGRYKPLYRNRRHRIIVSSTIVVFMWLYAALTGWTPSVVRSVLMVTIIEVGHMLYKKGNTLNSIAAAAVLILLFRPQDLFSVSFQLSFAAVTAIVVLVPIFAQLVPYTRNQFTNRIKQLVYVSLAAQLGTLPLTLHYFSLTSNYFLLTNIFLIPLAGVVMGGAVVILTLGWITPLGIGAAWLENKVVGFMNGLVGWIENLPGSTTSMECTWTMSLLLYGAVVFGALCLQRKRLWWLMGTGACLGGFCVLYLL